MDKQLRREIMLKHYQTPINKKDKPSDEYITSNANNASCIDEVNLHVLYDNNYIKDITFTGDACAICTSSTSIMIESLIGLSKEEAINFIEEFEKLLEGKEHNKELLKDTIVYDDLHINNNRITCAKLPYIAMKKNIK